MDGVLMGAGGFALAHWGSSIPFSFGLFVCLFVFGLFFPFLS
jgi:hypothetical protein